MQVLGANQRSGRGRDQNTAKMRTDTGHARLLTARGNDGFGVRIPFGISRPLAQTRFRSLSPSS
jgi:hypothetical protein